MLYWCSTRVILVSYRLFHVMIFRNCSCHYVISVPVFVIVTVSISVIPNQHIWNIKKNMIKVHSLLAQHWLVSFIRKIKVYLKKEKKKNQGLNLLSFTCCNNWIIKILKKKLKKKKKTVKSLIAHLITWNTCQAILIISYIRL